MTDAEKLALCKDLINDINVTDEQITSYLTVSASRILERLYPFGSYVTEVPDQHAVTQCELAVRMIARRGGEGEIDHSENGVSRKYATVNDEDILRRITPYAGVV
jgi:hypothetical protein